MNPKRTLFTATLVQDAAISVSGLDRETSADQRFALVDSEPTLVGRGLKGAAVIRGSSQVFGNFSRVSVVSESERNCGFMIQQRGMRRRQ